MKDSLLINSDASWRVTIDTLMSLYEKHKYVTIDYRLGEDRSLDQNALLHVWLTEYSAHLLEIDKRKVTKAQLASIKRKVKKCFYLEYGFSWMAHRLVDPFGEDKSKLDFTSSKDWKVPEMYMFLTWLQLFAANSGLILESKGQFHKLQQKEAAAA